MKGLDAGKQQVTRCGERAVTCVDVAAIRVCMHSGGGGGEF